MNRIKSFLKSLSEDSEGKAPYPDKQLAAAALLAEAAAMDGTFGGREQKTIRELLTDKFDLTEEETNHLLKAARKAQGEATHLMRFTRSLKDHMDEAERIEMIEMMWRVAMADGVIHDFEDNLIRRVAGLLYVPDRARGEARKRAEQKAADG